MMLGMDIYKEFKNAKNIGIICEYHRTNSVKIMLILVIYENDLPFITNYCMYYNYYTHH